MELNTSSPDTGSGIGTPFSLSSNGDDIDQVLLQMNSHGPMPGFGWANFAFSNRQNAVTPVSAAPVPAAVWQGGSTLALAGLLGWIRRKRQLSATR